MTRRSRSTTPAASTASSSIPARSRLTKPPRAPRASSQTAHIVDERRRPDIPAIGLEIDGIAELWYDDRDTMTRALASPEMKALHADGALFIERTQSFLVEEKTII